jgi:hypothetical protein
MEINIKSDPILIFQAKTQSIIEELLSEAYYTDNLGDDLYKVIYNIGSGLGSAFYECVDDIEDDPLVQRQFIESILNCIIAGVSDKFNLLFNNSNKLIKIYTDSSNEIH